MSRFSVYVKCDVINEYIIEDESQEQAKLNAIAYLAENGSLDSSTDDEDSPYQFQGATDEAQEIMSVESAT